MSICYHIFILNASVNKRKNFEKFSRKMKKRLAINNNCDIISQRVCEKYAQSIMKRGMLYAKERY